MRIILLAAGLAISSMVNAQTAPQSVLDQYFKLSLEKQAIANDAMSHYVVHIYRRDGSEVIAAQGDELRTALRYELACDSVVLKQFASDQIRSAPGLAEKKVQCVQDSFARDHQPYTARLSYHG